MVLTVQHRFATNFNILANYTYSKFLDSMDSAGWGSSVGGTNYQNSYCVQCNWGPSNFDQKHVFSFSGIYTLPFGRGAQFLNNNVIVDEVLGGWRLSATSRENTGSPFTPTMATNNTYAQAGGQYPDLIGNPKLANKSIYNQFNKDAFGFTRSCAVTNVTLDQTTCGLGVFGELHRNSLYGPDQSNLNLSFGKTFSLFEKTKFEVRADAQNALNHASFCGPDASITPSTTNPDGSLAVPNSPAIAGCVTDGGRHIQLFGKFTF
jgi:hypothetical protein